MNAELTQSAVWASQQLWLRDDVAHAHYNSYMIDETIHIIYIQTDQALYGLVGARSGVSHAKPRSRAI